MRVPFILFCLAGLLLGSPGGAAAQSWTRFRGENGAGQSQATTVPARWTDDDYLWQIDLPGVGHSSPVVWGDRIFLTTGDEETGARRVLAIEAASGRQLWLAEYQAAKHGKHNLNSFASATGVVDAKRFYSAWATPEEFAVVAHSHDGQLLWRADLGKFKGGHGFGVSLIVQDGLLIVPNEQSGDSSIIALEAGTGKQRWKIARDTKVSYSTPCILPSPAGEPQLILTNWSEGISGHDLRTGDAQWQTKVFDDRHVETSIGSPIIAGGMVIGVSGWLGYGAQAVAVRPRALHGGSVAEEVWRIERNAPLCTTPVVWDELVFLLTDDGIMTCADLQTGKVHWTKRLGGTCYASPIAVSGRIYSINVDGRLTVLAAAAEFEELGRMELKDTCHSTPAVAHGRLYLRTARRLMAVGGK